MKIAGTFLFGFLAMHSTIADESNLTMTVDGVTYSNVIFGTKTPASIAIRHSTGIATVPLDRLPPELQEQFHYDPQKAVEYQKRTQALAARDQALAARARMSAYEINTGVPENIGRFIAASKAARLERMDYLEKWLKSYDGSSPNNRNPISEQWVGEYREEFKKLQINHPMYFLPMPEKQPEVGMIGKLTNLRVQQIVNKEEAIFVRTLQLREVSFSLWMKGVDTSGFADDSVVSPLGVFQITGTKTYKTAQGSQRTVFVVEPVEILRGF